MARSQELNSAPTADATAQNAEAQKNTAPNGTERRPMSMKDYADSNSPVWNNLAYDDTSSQQKAMKEAHDRMVTEGKVVEVPESTMQKTAESFPDLRDMKQTADGRSDSQIYNWGIKKKHRPWTVEAQSKAPCLPMSHQSVVLTLPWTVQGACRMAVFPAMSHQMRQVETPAQS